MTSVYAKFFVNPNTLNHAREAPKQERYQFPRARSKHGRNLHLRAGLRKGDFARELGLGFRAFSEVTSETVDDRGGV